MRLDANCSLELKIKQVRHKKQALYAPPSKYQLWAQDNICFYAAVRWWEGNMGLCLVCAMVVVELHFQLSLFHFVQAA